MKKQPHFQDKTVTFRLSESDNASLEQLVSTYKTTPSKILRSLLSVPTHAPSIHSLLRQML